MRHVKGGLAFGLYVYTLTNLFPSPVFYTTTTSKTKTPAELGVCVCCRPWSTIGTKSFTFHLSLHSESLQLAMPPPLPNGPRHEHSQQHSTTMPPMPTPPSQPPLSLSLLECDYDLNPSVLYQAIEAKQWSYAIDVFDKDEQEDQASTWVVRKETNGKLRWRLLPLHAAVVFGAPLKLVELLLADFPMAAQCKDDQGMLPLHLAFRNESSWDVVDELLTAYPMAVFCTDRKGRTPLQCGATSKSTFSAGSSTASSLPGAGGGGSGGVGGGALQPADASVNNSSNGNATTIASNNTRSSFRAVVSVLELYSQIAVSGERKRAEQEARSLANTSITQLQESHLKTLTALKQEWETQQVETQRQMSRLEGDKEALQEQVRGLEIQLEQVGTGGSATTEMPSVAPAPTKMDPTDIAVDQPQNQQQHQKTYHDKVKALLKRYAALVEEREQMRAILSRTKKGESNQKDGEEDDEMAALEYFQRWCQEEDDQPLVSLDYQNEEKKTEVESG